MTNSLLPMGDWSDLFCHTIIHADIEQLKALPCLNAYLGPPSHNVVWVYTTGYGPIIFFFGLNPPYGQIMLLLTNYKSDIPSPVIFQASFSRDASIQKWVLSKHNLLAVVCCSNFELAQTMQLSQGLELFFTNRTYMWHSPYLQTESPLTFCSCPLSIVLRVLNSLNCSLHYHSTQMTPSNTWVSRQARSTPSQWQSSPWTSQNIVVSSHVMIQIREMTTCLIGLIHLIRLISV